MSLLGAVHAFLARECGADVADEAVVEYVTETVRGADAADAWRDLDELLAGLSPDVWGGHSTDQRQALLLHLWGKQQAGELVPQAHGDDCTSSRTGEDVQEAGAISHPTSRRQATHGAAPLSDGSMQQTRQAAGIQPSKSRLSKQATGQSAAQSASSDRRGMAERNDNENLDLLAALCPPGVGRDFLAHVLRDLHAGDMQGAAAWLLDGDLRTVEGSVEEAEEAWREAAAADERAEAEREAALRVVKQQLCNKYHLEAVAQQAAGSGRSGSAPNVWLPTGDAAVTVRYRDGIPVTTKGDKYVTQTLKEEWDGGSRGKVKTKGKRGVGFA